VKKPPNFKPESSPASGHQNLDSNDKPLEIINTIITKAPVLNLNLEFVADFMAEFPSDTLRAICGRWMARIVRPRFRFCRGSRSRAGVTPEKNAGTPVEAYPVDSWPVTDGLPGNAFYH
jgi:hypothetical protein